MDKSFKNTSVSSSNDLYEYLKAYHETYVYTIDISDKEDPELDAVLRKRAEENHQRYMDEIEKFQSDARARVFMFRSTNTRY